MKISKYSGLVLAGLLCEALSGVAAGAAAVFMAECFGEVSFLAFPLGLLSCAAFGLIQCAILRCIKYRLSMNLVAYSVFAQLLPAAAGLIGICPVKRWRQRAGVVRGGNYDVAADVFLCRMDHYRRRGVALLSGIFQKESVK